MAQHSTARHGTSVGKGTVHAAWTQDKHITIQGHHTTAWHAEKSHAAQARCGMIEQGTSCGRLTNRQCLQIPPDAE